MADAVTSYSSEQYISNKLLFVHTSHIIIIISSDGKSGSLRINILFGDLSAAINQSKATPAASFLYFHSGFFLVAVYYCFVSKSAKSLLTRLLSGLNPIHSTKWLRSSRLFVRGFAHDIITWIGIHRSITQFARVMY